MTTTIKQSDLVESIAAALQYISYYHPADYIAHLARAYERERSPAAKDAIAQILTNSTMSARGTARSARTPASSTCSSRSAWTCASKVSKAPWTTRSTKACAAVTTTRTTPCAPRCVADPQFERKNTKDNTPAVIFTELVPGDKLEVTVAAKGGGSENKSKLAMLNSE